MRLIRIAVQAFGLERMALVKWSYSSMKRVHILSGTCASLIEVIQLLHGSAHRTQSFQSILRKEVGVYLAEVLESNAAMRVQPLAVVVQLAADAREVEIEHR